MTVTEAEIKMLRHDLKWHYAEVDRLRTVMRRALNTLMRPPALDWPGDEHPFLEASRMLSEALAPNSTVGRDS